MEGISQSLGVVLITNNYFHDVATGMMFTAAVALWIVMRMYVESDDLKLAAFFLRAYKAFSRFAMYSLIWVLLAGVPRLYFYMSFEWSTSVGDTQIPAIIIKHILMFAIVGYGLAYWHMFSRKAKAVCEMLAREGVTI